MSTNEQAPQLPDIHDAYIEALRNGDAKDITPNDFTKGVTVREAARGYTATRAHGEGVDPVTDRKYDENNPFPNGPDQHVDADDTEALNAREGKENPTEDDVEYYRWLKNSSGRAQTPEEAKPKTQKPKEPVTPVEPAGPKHPDEKDSKARIEKDAKGNTSDVKKELETPKSPATSDVAPVNQAVPIAEKARPVPVTQAEADEAAKAATDILEEIAKARFDGNWSESSERESFLKFMDLVKKAYGTADLEDPRVKAVLSEATDVTQAFFDRMVKDQSNAAPELDHKTTVLGRTDLGHEDDGESSVAAKAEVKKSPMSLVSAERDVPVKGEDTHINNSDDGTFAVFDGMGGHNAGDVASKAARDATLDTSIGLYKNSPPEFALERIKDALSNVQARLDSELDSHFEYHGMGTTAVITQFVEHGGKRYIAWASVGDSRIYLKNGDEAARQLNTDETLVEELKALGEDVPAAKGNILTNALIAGDALNIKQSGIVDITEYKNLRVMLCSDGITGDKPEEELTDQQMRDAFNAGSVDASAQAFYEYSSKEDDKTVIVVDVVEDVEKLPESPSAATETSVRTRQSTASRAAAIATTATVEEASLETDASVDTTPTMPIAAEGTETVVFEDPTDDELAYERGPQKNSAETGGSSTAMLVGALGSATTRTTRRTVANGSPTAAPVTRNR